MSPSARIVASKGWRHMTDRTLAPLWELPDPVDAFRVIRATPEWRRGQRGVDAALDEEELKKAYQRWNAIAKRAVAAAMAAQAAQGGSNETDFSQSNQGRFASQNGD